MREEIRSALQVGAARYQAALKVLDRYGRANFTQTGGMCAGLEVLLERGYLLITDAEDSLPWDPLELRAWGVGYYASSDVCEGPEVFVDSADPLGRGDTSLETLNSLVERCLREVLAGRRSSGVADGVVDTR